MKNTLLISFLRSLIKDENIVLYTDDEFTILRDVFRIAAPSIINIDYCILLLDRNNRLVDSCFSNSMDDLSGFNGYKLDLPLMDSLKTGEIRTFTHDTHNKDTIKGVLYKSSLINEDVSISYTLCFISENFNIINITESLKKVEMCMQNMVKLFNKYCSDYKRLIKYLNSVQEGISAIDKEGFIIYANDACCNIMGAKREELLNNKSDKLAENKPLLNEILESKKSIIDTEYFLNFKGKTVHLINSGYPVFNTNGNIIGAIDIFRGIKRSRKLANTIAGYEASFKFDNIIGQSKKIKEKIELSKNFAKSSENILIEGESGTGKELFAQSIHNHSRRRNENFIAINCANLPNELVDSELFGYEEGAFTGAKKGGRPGKFELASGGTLFLDEIGEMPLHIQAKLLRAVEYKVINRIGSNTPVSVDVRIIAATNRNLKNLVQQGKFREDLYYRLKVFYISIPPLRDRETDVLLLVNFFLNKYNSTLQKNINGIDENAKKMLLSYEWPGNVRELENLISRTIFLCDSDYIKKEHLLMAGLTENHNTQIMNKYDLMKINEKIILDTYNQLGKNKKKTAETLGISRPTLYRILKRCEMDKS